MEKPTEVQCIGCKSIFVRTRAKRNNRFCTIECYYNFKRKNPKTNTVYGTRVCTDCKKEKTEHDFPYNSRHYRGGAAYRMNRCRPCLRAKYRLSINKTARIYEASLRKKVMALLGDKCSCCNETEPRFLTLEHIGGGGNAERRSLKTTGNRKLFEYILSGKLPLSKYDCLCYTCNFARAHNKGVCPHEIIDMQKIMQGMAC